jgi:CDGSH-type Zn-finger protein
MSHVAPTPRSPFAVEVVAGRQYAWCACGRSKQQPYCDGSHRGSVNGPSMFTAERSERVWLCGCKRTGSAPYCDGSHKHIPAEGVLS